MPKGRYEEVMERDEWSCQARSRFGMTPDKPCHGRMIVHHMKVKGMGGTKDPAINDADNLVVLCGGATGRDGCHGFVHDNPALSYEAGALIRHST